MKLPRQSRAQVFEGAKLAAKVPSKKPGTPLQRIYSTMGFQTKYLK
jgi:hypothetical protein